MMIAIDNFTIFSDNYEQRMLGIFRDSHEVRVQLVGGAAVHSLVPGDRGTISQ